MAGCTYGHKSMVRSLDRNAIETSLSFRVLVGAAVVRRGWCTLQTCNLDRETSTTTFARTHRCWYAYTRIYTIYCLLFSPCWGCRLSSVGFILDAIVAELRAGTRSGINKGAPDGAEGGDRSAWGRRTCALNSCTISCLTRAIPWCESWFIFPKKRAGGVTGKHNFLLASSARRSDVS
jgi:hypothetical protein